MGLVPTVAARTVAWLDEQTPEFDFGPQISEHSEYAGCPIGVEGTDDRTGRRERSLVDGQSFGADRRPRRAAMVTRSGSESAFILRIT